MATTKAVRIYLVNGELNLTGEELASSDQFENLADEDVLEELGLEEGSKILLSDGVFELDEDLDLCSKDEEEDEEE